jgi:methionyl-tRNA formyltransferase
MDKIILLCSGGLGELALRHLHQRSALSFVFTDKNSSSIINYCIEEGISFFAGNPRLSNAKPVIQKLSCNVLLSINYLFIVEKDLLSVACNYAINFHGSLLPKYRGRTPHVWAIINGETETGVSAHIMTGEVDNGDIVKQVAIPIEQNDTGASILKKFETIYIRLINDVLMDIENKTITPKPQDETRATYFGKRTSEDGLIDWSWQKERIRNWIRAQAEPYPGAYTYYGNQKMIIHEISYSNSGYHYLEPNGMIIEASDKPVIKTPNGAVELIKVETVVPIIFQKGTLLCNKLPLTKSASD